MLKLRFNYFYAALFSLILHILLLSGLVSQWIPNWKIAETKRSVISVLPVIELISTPDFISTEEMPAIARPVKASQFVSDRNTELRSLERGKGKNPLPTQQGRDLPGVQLRDKLESERIFNKPDTPSLQQESEQQQARENTLSENPLTETQKIQAREAAKKVYLERSKRQSEPTPFSFRQEKTSIQGTEVPLGDAGVNAEATPLGQYKAKVYQLIGSQWRFMVRRQNSLLSYGTVKIRFWLNADGSLANLEVLNQTTNSELLRTLSENSVHLCAPYESFSEAIQQQVGQTLMLEATFTIY